MRNHNLSRTYKNLIMTLQMFVQQFRRSLQQKPLEKSHGTVKTHTPTPVNKPPQENKKIK